MKTLFNLILCLMLLLPLASCDDFVAVDLPSGQLTAPAVFEEVSTARAAMADVYAKLRDSGLISGNASGLSVLMGVYADELDYYGDAAAAPQHFYQNSLSATDGVIAGLWNNSYSEIYAVNAIIEGVAASNKLSQADKNKLTGEALFVRGLVHFYLANLYGDIPYIKTTDYQQNSQVGRLPLVQVYDRVIADLVLAQSLLPEEADYERVLPNKAAATALLARVYLYRGNWAEAANEASAVLNSGVFLVPTDLDTVFLKDSPETIWQFKPTADGINTYEGQSFIFTAGPPPLVALRAELISAFEPGDMRRSNWVGSIGEGSTAWYFARKYKQQTNTGSSEEYSVVLRAAELYLIRAEARARQGELTSAKDDLNFIRNRAGLAQTAALTQAELLQAILQERRVELFTEHGHRFLDLKRFGQLDAVLGTVKAGWNASDVLLPLPESELLLNPNLKPQNAGY
ncbi:MAG: RagB/SusD family nutrient uptake outer membrane protein [Bacteroidetes bacterium]|nr:RagB/SusD family nutrient uptake outer membrane protein [Bacteroidota bacterium]